MKDACNSDQLKEEEEESWDPNFLKIQLDTTGLQTFPPDFILYLVHRVSFDDNEQKLTAELVNIFSETELKSSPGPTEEPSESSCKDSPSSPSSDAPSLPGPLLPESPGKPRPGS